MLLLLLLFLPTTVTNVANDIIIYDHEHAPFVSGTHRACYAWVK